MTKRIPLFEKNSSSIMAWATVDDEDYERLSRYKWLMSADGRAVREKPDGYIQMGREVLKVQKKLGTHIEHLDGDTLNNCRSNLKIRKDSGSN